MSYHIVFEKEKGRVPNVGYIHNRFDFQRLQIDIQDRAQREDYASCLENILTMFKF